MSQQPVFILSDRSGVTAHTICHTLLTQFPDVEFTVRALPFLDDNDKITSAIETINEASKQSARKSLVFTTFVEDDHNVQLQKADAVIFDLLKPFITKMEDVLRQDSSHQSGKSHGMIDPDIYSKRIGAVNYAMHCDDGLHTDDYDIASVILTAVSRSGKTPTCLYLALHFGLYAANYPLTEENFNNDKLPTALAEHKEKVFGLLIDPFRLSQIRQERRPGSVYASPELCKKEINLAKTLFIQHSIPYCNSTHYSIEELGSTIRHQMKLSLSYY